MTKKIAIIEGQKMNTKKSACADLVDQIGLLIGRLDNLDESVSNNDKFVNNQKGVDSPGVEPGRSGLSNRPSQPAEPTPYLV